MEEAEGRIQQLEDTTECLMSNREHDEKKMDAMWNRMQELAEKRKTFTSVKRSLQRLNMRYTLAYPGSLQFTWKGRNRSFASAKEVEQFIRVNCNTDG
ncbi:unnamed protein product [Gadus morhua 'NCC']